LRYCNHGNNKEVTNGQVLIEYIITRRGYLTLSPCVTMDFQQWQKGDAGQRSFMVFLVTA